MNWLHNLENAIESDNISFISYDIGTLDVAKYYLKQIDDHIFLDVDHKKMIDVGKLKSYNIYPSGGIIGDTVGLGKSFSIIGGLIAQRTPEMKTDLLLCPRTLMGQWEDEIKTNYEGIKYLMIYSIT